MSEMLNRKLTKSVVNKRKHDNNVNHYTCSTIDSQISTLANDTNDLANVSMVDNTKDKLMFDTSCTICATGLHRTHELTKCSGRQLTNKGTK